MTRQPVPVVTDEDVKRIAVRDFGEGQLSLVMSILEEYGKQEWNSPSPRVQLAILKLANGNLDRLLDETQSAIVDYRDVLGAAEYPGSMRIGILNLLKKGAEERKHSVFDEDWRQYCKWLRRK